MEASAILGWHPEKTHQTTLPELLTAITGWQRARGITPKPQPMSTARLVELAERYK